MGIREVKKGKLKLAVLESALELMKEKPFEKIKVLDICNQVGTSEVTFFKYFRRKEEILQYFMLVWEFRRSYRLKKEGYNRGLSGIYAIFEDIAATDNAVDIMTALIAFIATQREKPEAIKLEKYDKEAIIQENIQEEDYEDLNEHMIRLLYEAIEDGELSPDIFIEEIMKVISGVFYGVPLITHAASGVNLYDDYRCSLNYIFKGIKRGEKYEN